MSTRRDTLLVLLCGALVAGLAAVGALDGSGARPLWRGYLTLALREGVPYREALKRLGVHAWVDPERAEVSFTIFRGDEKVKVAGLAARFDPLDPRLDPYMRSLASYFDAGRGWRLVYVRRDRPLPLLTLDLLSALPGHGSRWLIADWVPGAGALAVAAAALLAACLWVGRLGGGAPGWAVALAAAGWAPELSRGSLLDLASFFLLSAGWALALPGFVDTLRERLVRRSRAVRPSLGWAPVAAVAAAAALAAAARAAAGGSLVSLAALAGLMPASALLAVALERRLLAFDAHSVFQPLRLGPRPRPPAPRPARRILALAPLALAVPMLVLGARSGSGLTVPAPEHLPGARAYTWPVMERLWSEGADSPLPDLSDYLVHSAYQQGIAYGRPYAFPTADVVVPVYQAAAAGSDRIERGDDVVIRYNAKWLARLLAGPEPGSVERLLLDQRLPVRVKYTALGAVPPSLLLWNGLMIALFGALVLFPVESLAGRARAKTGGH